MKRKSAKRPPSPAPSPTGRNEEGGEVAKARTLAVLRTLKKAYPDATCALDSTNAFELLAATILSAQCTDVRVNMVTPELFRRYPSPSALAAAEQGEVEAIIRSTGFFRNKARNLIAMAQSLVADHDGEVPNTMVALQRLPGVGRKTANVLLGDWFGINEGITVDTHVTRIARLLKLTRHSDAVKIEGDLMALVPKEDWTIVSHLLITHGRAVCIANRPRCGECVIARYCPSRLI